jgi:hypothetical protein
MIRSRHIATAVLVLVGLALPACEKAADDEAKAEKAQAVAADKLTAATVEADQKIRTAQAEADKKVAEAQASFQRLRENYRHDLMLKLTSLDEKIAKLTATEPTVADKRRPDFDAHLTQIRVARAALNADTDALESASVETWDASKDRVDKGMSELTALVNGR